MKSKAAKAQITTDRSELYLPSTEVVQKVTYVEDVAQVLASKEVDRQRNVDKLGERKKIHPRVNGQLVHDGGIVFG